MKKLINRLMAKLGYVPAPAPSRPSSATLKIEIDTSELRAALGPVQQLAAAATEAEAALAKLWNVQAAMRNSPPYAGVGSASGSSAGASAPAKPEPSATSVAADPFAPVFEFSDAGEEGSLNVAITLKPGAVVYLISATGPRSNAIKYSADGSKHVLVRPVVEIEPGS